MTPYERKQIAARASYEKVQNVIRTLAEETILSPDEMAYIDRKVDEFHKNAIRGALRRKAASKIAAGKFGYLLLKRVRAFRSGSMSKESTRAAQTLDRCLKTAGWGGAPTDWDHWDYCAAKKDFRERHKEYVL